MKSFLSYLSPILLMCFLFMGYGCVQDDFEGCKDKDEIVTIGYIPVGLRTSGNATRAVGDEYFEGEDSELALAKNAHHYIIFYTDGQETPLSVGTLTGIATDNGENKNVNSSVVVAALAARNEVKEELTRISECYVVLNSDINESELWTATRKSLMTKVVKSPFLVDAEGKRYFTMCNSVYMNTSGQKTVSMEIDMSKIYESYLEAVEKALKGEAAVTVYVERLAAKFSLRFAKEAYNAPDTDRLFFPDNNRMVVFTRLVNGIPFYENRYQGTGNPYEYRIRVTGWGMNALEKESYLFRNFDETKNYFTGWSAPANRRVFWSEDLNYRSATYPWQYRKVIDNSGIPVYSDKEDGNILLNLPFTELNANRFTERYLYTPENTYDFTNTAFLNSLDGRPHILAGTHMVVCAELLTNVEDGVTFKAGDLYRDRNGNFYTSELECFRALVAIMNNALESHSFLKFTYWDWDKGGVEMKLFIQTKGSYALWWNGIKLTPENIDYVYNQVVARGGRVTSEAEFKGGDGKRIIWTDGMTIRDDSGRELTTFSYIDEVNSANDKPLRPATVNDIKSAIFEQIGGLDHFDGGKMYYAIPIGLVENKAASKPSQSAYTVYGVVRNCSYDVMIHDISGIGASVDNPAEPIVSNAASTDDHLYISFDILDWHLTEQNVPGVVQ